MQVPTDMFVCTVQLPSFNNIHTLSVSRASISSITFNKAGDWIALGCASLGQLLVWEWRSESYILKQQGHFHDISTASFSPDGLNLVTGADDAKASCITYPKFVAVLAATAEGCMSLSQVAHVTLSLACDHLLKSCVSGG